MHVHVHGLNEARLYYIIYAVPVASCVPKMDGYLPRLKVGYLPRGTDGG